MESSAPTDGTRRYEPLPMIPLLIKGNGKGGDGGGLAAVRLGKEIRESLHAGPPTEKLGGDG